MPGIDDAWPTRLPPGWQTFPDGSIGPANAPSPIDSVWPTRLPGSSYGPPPETSLSGPGGGPASAAGGAPPYTDGLSVRPQVANPYGAGMPRGTGSDIISPQGSNVGTGKEVGPWNRFKFTDVPTDQWPQKPPSSNLWGVAAKALPYASRVLGPLAAYFGSTTPAETGEMPRQTLGRRPSGPAPAPAPAPVPAPIDPYGPTRTTGPPIGSPAPAVPPPRPRAVPVAVPQKPNLGYYSMAQPNIDPLSRGGRRGGGAPMMGVLGWDPNGPLFGRADNERSTS